MTGVYVKTRIIPILGIFIILALSTTAGTLSEQQQQELIDRVNYLHGTTSLETETDGHQHAKCGTDIALSFFNHQSEFTGDLAAKAAALEPRPNLALTYDSPGGHFKIHYNDGGSDAVYLAGQTTGGIPDYVLGVAAAADSAWQVEIVELGYPLPISDGTNGGDSRVDIYIENLGSSYYGATFPDTTGLPLYQQSVASFMIIDNDFNIPPYNQSDEMERRLDAARVTVAHEFFHVIHYTIDYTEYEYQGFVDFEVLPWWEMTAVWMEEEVYDDVNDYYYYLHSYLDYPYQSLRLVYGNTLHQYGAGIFPLFLDEKWGPDIIKSAWLNCRELGVGGQFYEAIDSAISEHTSGTDSLLTAFNEFATWNFYTGTRASRAPVGMGFSEAADFHMIPDSVIFTINMTDNFIDTLQRNLPGWPDTLSNGDSIVFFKSHFPQNLGTHYILLNNVQFVVDSVFSYRFYGRDPDDFYSWRFTHLNYPDNPAYDIEFISSENTSSKKFEFDPDGVDKIVAIATPVEPLNFATNYFDKDYDYSLFFNNQFDVITDTISSIQLSFGPNPVLWEDGNSHISFIIEDTDEIESESKIVDVHIDIFSIAGEKVCELSYPDEVLDQYSPIRKSWNLTNLNGSSLAGGVYYAIVNVLSNDGSINTSVTHKIALIK